MKTNVLLECIHLGLLLLMPFLVLCTLLMFGIALHLWLGEPQRLAGRWIIKTNVFAGPLVLERNIVFLSPQPLQITPSETNLGIVDPSLEEYISGEATNAAVWVNGIAFKSGGQAAWELVKTTWPLYPLTAASLLFLKSCSRQYTRRGTGGCARSKVRLPPT